MKEIRIKNPQTVYKYLNVLYQVDVLTTGQIAYFLDLSPEVAVKYLSELKRMGCIVDIRCAGTHYWHLKPDGVRALEAIEKNKYPFYATTVAQKSTGKINQNTKHDTYCSRAIMTLVQSSIEDQRGIWRWQGPTSVRTNHIAAKEVPFLEEPVWESTYKPDAMIGFYQGGQYGRMYVEYDSGAQYSTTIENKVIKFHKTLNLYREEKEDIILGFITHGGEQRRNNLRNFLKGYQEEYQRPVTVVIACEKDIIEGRGWDKIWISNRQSGLFDFKSLGINKWVPDDEGAEAPLFIGRGYFRSDSENTKSERDLFEVQET